jgi:hypothetical protein
MFEGNGWKDRIIFSNIQLPSIDHYFTYVFGEQNLVMFLVLINYIGKTLQ